MINSNTVSAVWANKFPGGNLVANRVMSLPIKPYTPLVQVSNETLTVTGGQVQTTVDKVFLVQNPALFSKINGTIEIIDSGPFRIVGADGNITTTITAQDLENKEPITMYHIPDTGKDPVIKFRTCDGNACSPPRETTLAITFDVNDPQMLTWWMWVVGSISAGVIIVAGVGGTVCVCTHRQSETAQNRLTARKKHDARAEGLKIKDEDDLHDSRVNPHSYFQPSGAPGRGGCYNGKQLELQPVQTLTP